MHGIRAAVRTGLQKITVLGTRATINSDAYRRGIHAVDPPSLWRASPVRCSFPWRRREIVDNELACAVLDIYLHRIRTSPPDAVLLGCTHYPLFRNALTAISAAVCASSTARPPVPIMSPTSFAPTPFPHLPGKVPNRAFRDGYALRIFVHAARFLSRPPERVQKVVLSED